MNKSSVIISKITVLLSNILEYVLDSTRILPIKSNPCSPDSDGDGIVDCIKYFDKHPNDTKYYRTEFSDPNPLKKEYLLEWPALYNGKIDSKTNGHITAANGKIKRLSGGFVDERNHNAIDIGTSEERGHHVLAAYDGVVIDINTNPNGGRGKYIYIMHDFKDKSGNIYFSRYIHLDSISEDLKIGDTVKRGQKIAVIGNTGTQYVHLDFQFGQLSDCSTVKNSNGKYDYTTGKIIHPILFSGYNILINFPLTLDNVCTGGRGYFEGKLVSHSCDYCFMEFNHQEYIAHKKNDDKISNFSYECNNRCIKCRYNLW